MPGDMIIPGVSIGSFVRMILPKGLFCKTQQRIFELSLSVKTNMEETRNKGMQGKFKHAMSNNESSKAHRVARSIKRLKSLLGARRSHAVKGHCRSFVESSLLGKDQLERLRRAWSCHLLVSLLGPLHALELTSATLLPRETLCLSTEAI